MNDTLIYVDFKKLLEVTSRGLDIYKMILPDLEPIDDNRFKNTHNPFYCDKNAALSVYLKEEIWQHNDFGDPDYAGDAIDMAALHYDLDRKKDFKKLLCKIVEDLHIDPQKVSANNDWIYGKSEPFIDPNLWYDTEALDLAYSYFKDYGISRNILFKYGVRGIRYYCMMDIGGNISKRWLGKDDLAIAYHDINHTKEYRPYAERSQKFRYIGIKPKEFVFGEGQILTNIRKTKEYDRDILIITGGEKDVLTLVSLGYDAISLNSETADIPAQLHEGLFQIYKRVIVLYDIDDTGKCQSRKLCIKYNLHLCLLPDVLLQSNGKDVSDYLKAGLDIDLLRKSIEDAKIVSDDTVEDQYSNEKSSSEQNANVRAGTPFLPDEVYDLIPQYIKGITREFDRPREKDAVLLSSLCVISSCLPKIKGVYDRKLVGCNFNLFITASASAGKGAMTWSRLLGRDISVHLGEKFKSDYRKYELQLAEYIENKKNDPTATPPEEPQQPRLYIPTDSSSTVVSELLAANKSFGIIFDSEGDTLSSILKNDWADYSTTIRKAFHHEPISYARRLNKEFREVETPHLSVLLSGTRNQVSNLIDSVENGLFSRFLFYDFEDDLQWKDCFGNGDETTQKVFEQTSFALYGIWKLAEKSKVTTILLDDEQKTFVNNYFSRKIKQMHDVFGDNIIGSVKRTCLIFYRLTMILTAISKYEVMNLTVNKMPDRIIVTEESFRCAYLIVDTLLNHLEIIFTRLQKNVSVSKLNFKQQSLYAALPDSFSWADFIHISEQEGIAYNTAQKYRRDFFKFRLLISPAHGLYKKV